MKNLAFFLAVALARGPLSATAAPATPSDATSRTRALALLDQSAAAYGKIGALSLRFSSSVRRGGHSQRTAGAIAFDKIGRYRINVTPSPSMFHMPLVQSVGMPANPVAARALLGDAITRVQSLGWFLGPLVRGKNPLRAADYPFQNIRVLPGNGVSATLFVPAHPEAGIFIVTLFIDPKDHLLRRVEVEQRSKSDPSDDSITLSDIRINPVFAPNFFAAPAPRARPLAVEADADPDIYWDPKIQVGTLPLPINGTDLSGTPRDLSQYKGKVLLVDFWATWCGPCVGELPTVLANHKKYGPQGFEVLAISLDSDKKTLTDFVAERGMTWPQLFDGKAWKTGAVKNYGVKGIPFTLLIGKDGRIAAINPRGEKLEPAIKAALAQ